MLKPTECGHASFHSIARVGRLTQVEGGPVTGYTLDLTVKCVNCGLPFRFIGLPAGSSPFQPMRSADGLELRAPLEPAYTTEICGIPITAGRA